MKFASKFVNVSFTGFIQLQRNWFAHFLIIAKNPLESVLKVHISSLFSGLDSHGNMNLRKHLNAIQNIPYL